MSVQPPAARLLIGRALLASAALLLAMAALFWLRVIAIAEETRAIVSSLFLLIGFVEGVVGLRFLGES